MKNWQSQSNSKVKGKNMLVSLFIGLFLSKKKKKFRGTKKKKKFFQKITYLNLRLNQNKFRKNAQA